MSDHPNEDQIRALYEAEAEQPATTIVLEDDGPRVTVNTGYTDDAVEAQLSMIAGYVTWLAHRTEVDLEQVADDALEIAEEMRDADSVYVDKDALDELQ